MKINHWQRLGLPVALGICAAFLNWSAVSSKLEPRAFVAAKNDLVPGKPIQLTDLEMVKVSYSSTSNLDQTLIPWGKAPAIVGNYLQRPISGGCLLTPNDLPETNIAYRSADEEVIEVKQSKGDKPVFVNDIVDLRLKGVTAISGGRVLSITRGKDESGKERVICLGVSAEGLQAYDRLSEADRNKLKLADHIQKTDNKAPHQAHRD